MMRGRRRGSPNRPALAATVALLLAVSAVAAQEPVVPPATPVQPAPEVPSPLPAPPPIQSPEPQPLTADARIEAARQAYEATNYEAARDQLDGVVAGIVATGVTDPAQVMSLVAAYELRGRSRMNLRDVEGARADFRALLLLDPAYVLPVMAGPRAQTLFDEVRRATVGQVDVVVTPADAELALDGVRLAQRVTSLTLAAGTHTLTASVRGYRTGAQTFTIVPGAPPQAITLLLEREFSTLAITTQPAGVEVVLNDVVRGRTAATSSDAPAGNSEPLTVEGLPSGRHRLEFRRECFITAERVIELGKPDDVFLEPVRLEPAVATVAVTADGGGTVFVDDVSRGPAPQTLGDICRGAHVLEVRSDRGRHLRRIDVTPGEKVSFAAAVRPAFALIPTGVGDGAESRSLRLAAESTLQQTRTITLFVPPESRTTEALTSAQAPAGWLLFDSLRQPVGPSGAINDSTRRDVGTQVSRTLSAQGVAIVSKDPSGGPTDMLLTLLAPGSGKPDILRWKTDSPATVAQMIARLDEVPPLTRASLGLLAIDVLDVAGAVIASVEATGSAQDAGLQAGDTIVQVDGKPLTNAAQLRTMADTAAAGQMLVLDVRGRDGAERKASIAVQRVPLLVAQSDQTVLSNTLAVAYTGLASQAASPTEEAAIRLNLATAWMRLENWSEATRELQRVTSLAAGQTLGPAVRDAVAGTAQFLLASCAEAAGDLAGAERALTLAVESRGALLTDGGEPIRTLSERRLAQLRRARGAN